VSTAIHLSKEIFIELWLKTRLWARAQETTMQSQDLRQCLSSHGTQNQVEQTEIEKIISEIFNKLYLSRH
jgi:hypothetical protein